jgi:predicted Zn-dependent protease
MKTSLFLRLVLVSGLAALLAYCAKAPYTERSQLMLVSQEQETQLGASAAKDILKKEPIANDPNTVELVRRVGERIAAVADRPDFSWAFYVIDEPETINAFCLPGGKVFVYTGILPLAPDEAQLATVMGHEIAHALARHGAERMSMALAAEAGGAVASAALGFSNPTTANAFMQAYGVATNVGVLLPYSRAQESEADQIGLALMAKAGYDPAAAVTFWQNMEKAKEGKAKPPAFLSTHPADAERIANIERLIPWARQYSRPN